MRGARGGPGGGGGLSAALGRPPQVPVLDPYGRVVFHGGMEDLSRFHTTLVKGGAPWASLGGY